MNIERLKAAEKSFLRVYPGGFANEAMAEMIKKHRMDKMIQFSHESFSKEAFEKKGEIIENMIRLVSRSSMVSMFEKPKFRDTVRAFSDDDKNELVEGLFQLLHGDEESGFNRMVDLLAYYKLAKWTLISVFPCYYSSDRDLIFKPTTVKNAIKFFEIEDLQYRPRPSYDFFVRYRKVINEMKELVDPSLSPSNSAFSGFLRMTSQPDT